ncbi:MAG: cytochrome c3 family protein [Planctomycetota bacterium]
MQRWIWTAVGGLTLVGAAIAWSGEPAATELVSGYAGSKACSSKDCHPAEYAAFVESNHRKYVQIATPQTVIGDFAENNVLEAGGKKTTMVRRGDAFFIRTTGPDGRLHEYRVQRTIGHDYKQRYSTTLADGRRYILPVQWNKNEKRWVDYHGLAKTKPGSGQYWCDLDRNTAMTCGGCHGTGVTLVGDPPKLLEAEMSIGCEACHGPAAAHCKDEKNPDLIKAISLKSLSQQRQVDVCGKCHCRGEDPETRTDYPAGFLPGDRLSLTYAPVEPTIGKKTGRFWPDGRASGHHQQHIEFVRSPHYTKAGMTCISCHENHASHPIGVRRLKDDQQPNDLCLACHEDLQGAEALKEHTFHDPAKEGAVCIDCHMPRLVKNEQPFQLHHHGASIPNPRKALAWGAPDACSLCHYHQEKGDTPKAMLAAMVKWGIPPQPIKVKIETEEQPMKKPVK